MLINFDHKTSPKHPTILQKLATALCSIGRAVRGDSLFYHQSTKTNKQTMKHSRLYVAKKGLQKETRSFYPHYIKMSAKTNKQTN